MPDTSVGMVGQMPEMKKKSYPSTLQLDEGDIPEIKNWKTGGEYTIQLTVKQVMSASGEHNTIAPYDDDDKEKVHAKFEVLSAKVVDSPAEEKAEPKGHDEEDEDEVENEADEKDTEDKAEPKKVVGAVKRKMGY